MTTAYPNSIDGLAELPVRIDLVDEIKAIDHNTLRGAIIAIETELGINPSSGSATVADRLNSILVDIELINDETPQLGGNLDLNGWKITDSTGEYGQVFILNSLNQSTGTPAFASQENDLLYRNASEWTRLPKDQVSIKYLNEIPATAQGDILYNGPGSTWKVLPKGTDGFALVATATDIAWASLTIGEPGDGNYGRGTEGSISGLESTDLIADAFDKVDTLLSLLAPPKPPNLSTFDLTMTSDTYTAVEAGTGNLKNNGLTVGIVTDNANPRAEANGFFSGDSGDLEAYIDASQQGIITLTQRPDEPSAGPFTPDTGVSNGSLLVDLDYDFHEAVGGKEGFWTALNASITSIASFAPGGANTYEMRHSETGDTSVFTFYVDTPQQPSIVGQKISDIVALGAKRVSGVPSLEANDQVNNIVFTTNDAVSEFYHQTTINQVTGTSINDLSTLPVAPIPSVNDPVSENVSTTVASGSIYQENLQVTCKAFASKPGASFEKTETAVLDPTVGLPAQTRARIDTVTNESDRLRSGDNTQFPSIGLIGAAWTPNEELQTGGNAELQKINGLYQYPFGNYTDNYPVQGPDYTTINTAGVRRWVTYKINSFADSGGILTINSQSGFSAPDNFGPGDMDVLMRVDGGATDTSWGNAGKFSSPTFPPVPGNDNAGIIAAGNPGSAGVRPFTFQGTKVGNIYIRIGWSASGKSFSSVRLQSSGIDVTLN